METPLRMRPRRRTQKLGKIWSPMRGCIKRYWGNLQEAVEGAYHAKHLEKGVTQKDSRGWGVAEREKEKGA